MDDILRTPYAEPDSHLELDAGGRNTGVELPGRRPSMAASGLPGVGGEVDPEVVEPHKTINRLRLAVKEWRDGGYPGTTSNTRRLLEFWLRTDPGTVGMRPFWCQMEAIETIVWLFEAGQSHNPSPHQKIMDGLDMANRRHNDGIPRAAFKMATGTGKTNVMAMTMLWILVNRENPDGGSTNFLVIAPNLPVKDRLRVLKPNYGKELWGAITPRSFRRHIKRAEVSIVNFQAFQRKNATFDGKSPGKREWALLGESAAENFRESDADMVRRVLKSHGDDSKFIVINDEAHHCYKPAGTVQRGGDEEERESAALWFSALKVLNEQGRLERVYDFSATPMWLSVPRGLDSELFPWTVSDYPLLDAIESGLVKMPRVPVRDDTESHEPRYRKIYEHNDGKDLTDNLSTNVHEPLKQLYHDYQNKVSPKYEDIGVIPVFIVVANNIKNATALYRWIAGSWDKKSGRGTRGKFDMFSNYGMDGRPVERPPTMLVHSKPPDKTLLAGRYKDMVEEQSGLFGFKGRLADREQQIRDMLTSIGSGDAKHIRCVVSVSMLTEGWDAKNVTHVFGYRKFDSLLLCEQVTGRALRRTSFVGYGKQTPEYANVFGVPYTFARGGETDPQPPVQPYDVFSVPEREMFRIQFPNVVDYRNPEVRRRFRLDPAKVKPYTVPDEPTETVVGGAGGEELRTSRRRREQTAIWYTARSVSRLLNADSGEDHDTRAIMGRGLSFADSVGIVKEWLEHPNVTCADVAGIAADPHASQHIADACVYDDRHTGPRPVFADERMEGERVLATEDVMFQTTLRHTYPEAPSDGAEPDILKKSELNRAACHTHSEVVVARVLDTHPLIEAWARNFRLDFRIPWLDEGARRYMEPDFVARAKTKDGGKLHLVIEFKGERQGEVDEETKRRYMEKVWCPAVSGYAEYGEWRGVWIEDVESAHAQISEACS